MGLTVSDPEGARQDMGPMTDAATDSNPTTTRHAPTVQSWYSSHFRPDQLGPDAINYVDQITKAMANYGLKISVKYVSTPKVTVVVVVDDSTKNAVNLLFACSFHQTEAPVASANVEARQAVYVKDPTINVQQTIVVPPEDYVRASQMAAFLANFFTNLKEYANDTDLSVTMFRNNRFKIITDIDRVRAFVDQYSPHSVRARDDIGFLLYYETEENGPAGRQVNQEEFMAVTGYTRFIKATNPQMIGAPIRYQPVVTITDIVCPLPNANLIALALATAVNVFITNGMSWTRPYGSCAKGMPNLGNLVTINGQPQPATTAEQLKSVIFNYMNQPWLAVDVAEGRARLHAIDLLTMNNGRGLFERISMFLNAARDTAIPDVLSRLGLVGTQWVNVTGVYQDQVLKDTRCVDYLNLIEKVRKPNEIDGFNYQTSNPNETFNAIKAIHVGDSTRALYVVTTCVLVGQVVSWISEELCRNNALPIVDLATCGPISLDYLMRQDAMTKFQSNMQMVGNGPNYGTMGQMPYNFFNR